MKTLILASALVLALTSSFAKQATPSNESVAWSSSKSKNLFVFRAKKKFVGATVAIYSSHGEMITAQQLQKRKIIINFGDAQHDIYTIRIAKGSNKQEFQYVKN